MQRYRARRDSLEIQGNLRRQRPRSYKVRAAEGGKEVIQRVLVGNIDGRDLQVCLAALGAEEIVLA